MMKISDSVVGVARAAKRAVTIDRRVAESSATYYLRRATVGSNPIVRGPPVSRCSHLTIGDDLLVFSQITEVAIIGSRKITLGNRCFLNTGAIVSAQQQVTIEDDVPIAYHAFITDSNGHGPEGKAPHVAPVRIGHGSWVGARAIILPGVEVGSRAVIATGSVVTHDVPPETLVAGAPARQLPKLTYPPGVVQAWYDSESALIWTHSDWTPTTGTTIGTTHS